MDFIDYRDPRPIYEQIAERYKTLILKGVLQPGDQMPSVRSLAVELSTNPNTVQKSYAALEREGFIYTVKGKGNYVSGGEKLMEEKKQDLAGQIASLLQEADDLGLDCNELIRMASIQVNKNVSGQEFKTSEGGSAKFTSGKSGKEDKQSGSPRKEGS